MYHPEMCEPTRTHACTHARGYRQAKSQASLKYYERGCETSREIGGGLKQSLRLLVYRIVNEERTAREISKMRKNRGTRGRGGGPGPEVRIAVWVTKGGAEKYFNIRQSPWLGTRQTRAERLTVFLSSSPPPRRGFR